MTPAIPSIRKIFRILLPITFPRQMSGLFSIPALTLTINSGADVPKATTVNPIASSGTASLNASADVILERTKRYHHRPLLNTEDPKAKIEDLLKIRAPFYAQADFSIDTTNLTVQQVVEEIKNYYGNSQHTK